MTGYSSSLGHISGYINWRAGQSCDGGFRKASASLSSILTVVVDFDHPEYRVGDLWDVTRRNIPP